MRPLKKEGYLLPPDFLRKERRNDASDFTSEAVTCFKKPTIAVCNFPGALESRSSRPPPAARLTFAADMRECELADVLEQGSDKICIGI